MAPWSELSGVELKSLTPHTWFLGSLQACLGRFEKGLERQCWWGRGRHSSPSVQPVFMVLASEPGSAWKQGVRVSSVVDGC